MQPKIPFPYLNLPKKCSIVSKTAVGRDAPSPRHSQTDPDSPQQGDLRLLGPSPGQGADSGSNPPQKGPCRSQSGLANHCHRRPSKEALYLRTTKYVFYRF
ncbi:hypothetical protein PoB_002770300 [Plakobranchus ocellatus]|uniref:Uncharacterized protein n=1 Tax=Plakobranchus ocellatus TaxID=259542 RepID=A0AAV4A3G4_9GAST|nr:hypothetical protein PoB_002770300 [Plakobranchus ocellatus]